MANKQTIVLFSPLPPRENGIADYVGEQVYLLNKYFNIIAVIDNGAPYPDDLSRLVKVIRLEEYKGIRGALGGFVHVYHIGNNPDHGYMLPVLLDQPGIVVIHDLGLHHLYDSLTLSKGDFSAYAFELRKQYGRSGLLLGNQVKEVDWKGQFMPHALRLNSEIIRSASSIIVHSEFSRYQINKEWPTKLVHNIPHHLSPRLKQFPANHRDEYKNKLALPKDRVVLTSLGFITEAKQARSTLRALAALKKTGLKFRYVLAGAYRPEEYDVKLDISRYGLEQDVQITGFLSDDAFFSYLAASDVVINLRYPYGGETSGTLTRALGMGRCCVVVDIGAFAEVPDDCVIKVKWSKVFDAELEKVLGEVVSDLSLRARYELNAHEWSNKHQNIAHTVRQYQQAISESKAVASSDDFMMRQFGVRKRAFLSANVIEKMAGEHLPLFNEVIKNKLGSLWWREGLVGLPSKQDSALLVCSNEEDCVSEVLGSVFGYKPEQLTWVGAGQSPSLELRSFNTEDFQSQPYIIALTKTSMGLAEDPMLWVFDLAWRLELGGEALISVVNDMAVSSDNVSLDFHGMVACLEAAGFQVEERHQCPSAVSFHQYLKAEHPEWAFRVVKIGQVVERFPADVYQNARKEQFRLSPLGPKSQGVGGSDPVEIIEWEAS